MTNEERVIRLVDRSLYNSDTQYHTEVRMFSHWLRITEQALLDEGYTETTAAAVLDRIALGIPSGVEAFHRIEQFHRDLAKARDGEPRTVFVPAQPNS